MKILNKYMKGGYTLTKEDREVLKTNPWMWGGADRITFDDGKDWKLKDILNSSHNMTVGTDSKGNKVMSWGNRKYTVPKGSKLDEQLGPNMSAMNKQRIAESTKRKNMKKTGTVSVGPIKMGKVVESPLTMKKSNLKEIPVAKPKMESRPKQLNTGKVSYRPKPSIKPTKERVLKEYVPQSRGDRKEYIPQSRRSFAGGGVTDDRIYNNKELAERAGDYFSKNAGHGEPPREFRYYDENGNIKSVTYSSLAAFNKKIEDSENKQNQESPRDDSTNTESDAIMYEENMEKGGMVNDQGSKKPTGKPPKLATIYSSQKEADKAGSTWQKKGLNVVGSRFAEHKEGEYSKSKDFWWQDADGNYHKETYDSPADPTTKKYIKMNKKQYSSGGTVEEFARENAELLKIDPFSDECGPDCQEAHRKLNEMKEAEKSPKQESKGNYRGGSDIPQVVRDKDIVRGKRQKKESDDTSGTKTIKEKDSDKLTSADRIERRTKRKDYRRAMRNYRRDTRRYNRTMRRKAREQRREDRGMMYTQGRRISPRRWWKNLKDKLGGKYVHEGRAKGYMDFRTSTRKKPVKPVKDFKEGGVTNQPPNRKFNRFSDYKGRKGGKEISNKEVQEFLKQNKAAKDMQKHRDFIKKRDMKALNMKMTKEFPQGKAIERKIKMPKGPETSTKNLTKKQMRRILMKKGGKQLLKRMVPMITAAEIAYLIATADKEAPTKQLKKRAKNKSYNIGRKI